MDPPALRPTSPLPRCPLCRGPLGAAPGHAAAPNCVLCGMVHTAGGAPPIARAAGAAQPGVRPLAAWPSSAARGATAPPALPRCDRCQTRWWTWVAFGPARGEWRCASCKAPRGVAR